jgi:hypothetical protein
MNTPRPCFMPICSTSFCFNALYQFTPFPNLNTVTFSLTPYDWLISTYLSLFHENMPFLFMPTIPGIQLGRKTRTMYTLFQKMHFLN